MNENYKICSENMHVKYACNADETQNEIPGDRFIDPTTKRILVLRKLYGFDFYGDPTHYLLIYPTIGVLYNEKWYKDHGYVYYSNEDLYLIIMHFNSAPEAYRHSFFLRDSGLEQKHEIDGDVLLQMARKGAVKKLCSPWHDTEEKILETAKISIDWVVSTRGIFDSTNKE